MPYINGVANQLFLKYMCISHFSVLYRILEPSYSMSKLTNSSVTKLFVNHSKGTESGEQFSMTKVR